MNKSTLICLLLAAAATGCAQINSETILAKLTPETKSYPSNQGKFLYLNAATLPYIYKKVTGEPKELEYTTYFKKFRTEDVPVAYQKTLSLLQGSQNEFTQHEATEQLMPLAKRAEARASSFEYVLIPVRVVLGTYDFDNRRFPVRLEFEDSFDTPLGALASFCVGALRATRNKYGSRDIQTPCVALTGVSRYDSNVIPFLSVHDEALAKKVKSAVWPSDKSTAVIARLVNRPAFTPTTPYSGGAPLSFHLLFAEPVSLLIYDSKSGEVLASADASKSAGAAASSANSVKAAPGTKRADSMGTEKPVQIILD